MLYYLVIIIVRRESKWECGRSEKYMYWDFNCRWILSDFEERQEEID